MRILVVLTLVALSLTPLRSDEPKRPKVVLPAADLDKQIAKLEAEIVQLERLAADASGNVLGLQKLMGELQAELAKDPQARGSLGTRTEEWKSWNRLLEDTNAKLVAARTKLNELKKLKPPPLKAVGACIGDENLPGEKRISSGHNAAQWIEETLIPAYRDLKLFPVR